MARQQSQSSPDPAGKDSATSSPILTEDGTSVRLSFHSCSLLLLADESSGVTVLGSIFFDLCEGGSRIADLESGRVRDVHASTVNPAFVIRKCL